MPRDELSFGAAFGGIACGAYYFVHELFKVGIDEIGNVQLVLVVWKVMMSFLFSSNSDWIALFPIP